METMLSGVYHKGVIELLDNVEMQDHTNVTVRLSTDLPPTETLINLLEQWKAEGSVSCIPDEAPGKYVNQPVKITGKPVSEIILEDRGAK